MSNTSLFSNRSIHLVASLAALVLCAACSSVSGGLKSPSIPPSGPSALTGGQKIGNVEVLLDKQQLTPSVTGVAEAYEVTRILGNRVREQLALRDMGAEGGLEVRVEVIGMRMRSNGTAFWWGLFSGADWITVEVEVTEEGRSIKQFQTGTATVLGGFIFAGRSTRIGRMMKTLSIRIAEGI